MISKPRRRKNDPHASEPDEIQPDSLLEAPEDAETHDSDKGETHGPTTDCADTPEGDKPPSIAEDDCGALPRRSHRFQRIAVFAVLPLIAVCLAAAAGALKWKSTSLADDRTAAIQSVQAATDITIKMLSYKPDSVDRDLGQARDGLTGSFRDSYTSLTKEVVIPGAKQKQISAVATVPAASSVSATANRAVVMLFIDQSIIVGNDPPSATASTVKVTLEKQNERWLISGFDPI
jgi:Mce-associated membrane protein